MIAWLNGTFDNACYDPVRRTGFPCWISEFLGIASAAEVGA